jgi:ribonuclease VapC
VILDSSAVIAAICREPDAERILETLNSAKLVAIGAPTLAETHLALSVKLGRDAGAPIEQFLQACQAMVIPFSREHVPVFLNAWLRFGKGRHPARLNMGDCFTYAFARTADMPILSTGNNFTLTDLKLA